MPEDIFSRRLTYLTQQVQGLGAQFASNALSCQLSVFPGLSSGLGKQLVQGGAVTLERVDGLWQIVELDCKLLSKYASFLIENVSFE
jgi:hypothetical protein